MMKRIFAFAIAFAIAPALGQSITPQIGGGISRGFDGGIGGTSGNTPLAFLRVVTPLNSGWNVAGTAQAVTGTVNTHAFRVPIVIAQDSADLVLGFTNKMATNNGNAFTIIDAAIDTGTVAKPVLFGGSAGTTIADGAVDVHADALLASQFSKPKFSRGEIYYVKGKIQVLSGVIPYSIMATTFAGNQKLLYDPAATSVSSTYTAGAYTSTGTAPATMVNPYSPMVLGHPLSDNPSFLVNGDSLATGVQDTDDGGIAGLGQIQRGLIDADRISNPRPGINTSGAGAQTGQYNGWTAFASYINTGIDELGTNDIGSSNAASLENLKAQRLSVVQMMRLFGLKRIIRTQFPPRNTSTDFFATAGGQTPVTGWGAGQNGPNLSAYFLTKLNDAIYQGVMSAASAQDPVTATAWLTNGTSYTPNVTVGSGSNAFSFSSGTFNSGDIGKVIGINGAGVSGGSLLTSILTAPTTTSITTAATAGTILTASPQIVGYATHFPTFDGLHPHDYIYALLGGALRTLIASLPNSNPVPSVLPPVLNPYDAQAGTVLSNGNLTVASGAVRGTTPITAANDLKYFEVPTSASGGTTPGLATLTEALGVTNTVNSLQYFFFGSVSGGGSSGSAPAYSNGDVLCFAVNFAALKLAVRVNGGNWNGNAANDPAVGAYSMPAFSSASAVYPYFIATNAATIRFSGFSFPVPTGYSAITGGGV